MADKPYNSKEEFDRSVSYGVSFDNVNLRTVSFWLILGTLIVTIILYGIYNMYAYNQFLSSERAAINVEFYELKERREQENRKLNTIELIDEEEGRYRIPIDSAMSLIATDSK